MSGHNIRLLPSVLQSTAGAFTGIYQKLGSPLENPPRIMKFTNNSTVDLLVSWDGDNDHEILPAGSFLLLDIAANKQEINTLYVAAGTQFWIKGTGGAGSVYLSVYYA